MTAAFGADRLVVAGAPAATAVGPRLDRASRRALAAALVATAAGLCTVIDPLRRVETAMAAAVARLAGADPVIVDGPRFAFEAGGSWAALRVSTGCSVVLLATPFLLGAAVLALVGRTTPRRLLTATASALAFVVVLNQLRFATITTAIRIWRFDPGYEVGHVLLGNTVSVLGVATGLLAFLRITSRQ